MFTGKFSGKQTTVFSPVKNYLSDLQEPNGDVVSFLNLFVVFLCYGRYRKGFFRRIREAANEGDVLAAARQVVSLMWVVFGYLWHGYEVVGMENIPDSGPALIVYYHGALPVDYYFLVASVLLEKRRTIHSVVDRFLFKVPGLGSVLSVFQCTPGTVESCSVDLRGGHLLGLAPGGVFEAQFSDHHTYSTMWRNRTGFARIALGAKVPVVPVFTQNVREAFRAVGLFRSFAMSVYQRVKLPILPIYGGFPVKLRTFVGAPIVPDPADTPEGFRDKCQSAIRKLIRKHQRMPGSMFLALTDRIVPYRGHRNLDD